MSHLWQRNKRHQLTERRLAPATTTPPLYACTDKVACVGPVACEAFIPMHALLEGRIPPFIGREGVVAQQMGGSGGPWALVCTRPGEAPRIVGWMG